MFHCRFKFLFIILSLQFAHSAFPSCPGFDKLEFIKDNYPYIFHVKVLSSSGDTARDAPVKISLELESNEKYKIVSNFIIKRRELAKKNNCFFITSSNYDDDEKPNMFDVMIGAGPAVGRIICRYEAKLKIINTLRGPKNSNEKIIYVTDHFITSIHPGTDVISQKKEYLIGFNTLDATSDPNIYTVRKLSQICGAGLYEVKETDGRNRNKRDVLNYYDVDDLSEKIKKEKTHIEDAYDPEGYFNVSFFKKIKDFFSNLF